MEDLLWDVAMFTQKGTIRVCKFKKKTREIYMWTSGIFASLFEDS